MFITPPIFDKPNKSQWLMDFEKYLAEQPAKPRIKLVVKAPKPRGPRYDYSGKERQRLLRAKRRDQGLCTKCGRIPEPDMKSCANCLDKKRAERLAA